MPSLENWDGGLKMSSHATMLIFQHKQGDSLRNYVIKLIIINAANDIF